MTTIERLVYPISEAAALLGIGRTTVYGLISEGLLESITINQRRLIPRAALEEYIARLRSEQNPART